MKRAPRPAVGIARPGGHRQSAGPALRLALLAAAATLVLYLLWPFAALWQLDRAARYADMDALAQRIDIDSVRGELKRKLNKEASSTIGTLSDPFIHWLEEGIQTLGSAAVDRLVTLDWVRQRLVMQTESGSNAGVLGQIAGAHFDSPVAFHLTVGNDGEHPLQLRMRLDGLSWRVTAVYY